MDDFEENEDYTRLSKTLGMLKNGVEKTFTLEDGKLISFGSDALCDVVIPLGDIIDPKCFTIYNKQGRLLIVD